MLIESPAFLSSPKWADEAVEQGGPKTLTLKMMGICPPDKCKVDSVFMQLYCGKIILRQGVLNDLHGARL